VQVPLLGQAPQSTFTPKEVPEPHCQSTPQVAGVAHELRMHTWPEAQAQSTAQVLQLSSPAQRPSPHSVAQSPPTHCSPWRQPVQVVVGQAGD